MDNFVIPVKTMEEELEERTIRIFEDSKEAQFVFQAIQNMYFNMEEISILGVIVRKRTNQDRTEEDKGSKGIGKHQ